jgi:flavin-dependent dehydrogenase
VPDADVLIAGGGPVGLATAIEARLAGLSAVVVEPRPAPIDKACGEGLMPGAVHALARLGVEPPGRAFAGITYVDGHRSVSHRFALGPGLGVRRTVLYDVLAKRAADLGVVVTTARVAQVEAYGDGVTVRTTPANGVSSEAIAPMHGSWLLACDGLHSDVRRLLGLAQPVTAWRRYGMRRHFRVAPWSEFVEVHWTPHAEIYVTPVADDEVGVAVLGARGFSYESVIDQARAVERRIASAEPVSALRGAGPLLQRTSRRTTGRVLLVGDASGYVDALTGEGIRLGLAQARAAVEAIAAGRPDDYERAWRRLTRDYRLLTSALVGAANRPALRRRIVPFACRLPRLYGAIVDRLAG